VVVTDLAVYHFDDEGQMRLDSLHPGVQLAQVRESTEWDLRIADPLPTTPEPSREELHLIRDVLDPEAHYRA
jgi:glutaconate CoA-transferase subunit B